MKWILILMTLLFATQQANAGFIEGNQLNEWFNSCDSIPRTWDGVQDNTGKYHNCGSMTGYIAGVYDSYKGANMLSKCFPNGVILQQLEGVTKNRIAKHPERWHEPADRLVLAAINEAWPCPE